MVRQLLVVAVGLCVTGAGVPTLAQPTRTAPARAMQTQWGEPDLTGIWTNETITPFERPASLAGKAFLTEDEARAIESRAADQRDGSDDRPPRAGDVGNYNQFWMDSGTKVVASRRTSLVIDPPDGRVPLRPESERGAMTTRHRKTTTTTSSARGIAASRAACLAGSSPPVTTTPIRSCRSRATWSSTTR